MPTDDPRELEAKFAVAPDTHCALFTQPVALAGYTVHSAGTVTHLDTYLDTPAFELLRQGLSLRLRQQGDHLEVGLKSTEATRQGEAQTRLDCVLAIPTHARPLETKSWPAAIAEQLERYSVSLDELQPVLVVRQQRQKATIAATGSAAPLAEWSLDAVWINTAPTIRGERAPVPQPAADGHDSEAVHTAHFHDLEIELLETESSAASTAEREADFGALVRQIGQRFELTPHFSSKFVRGLHAAVSAAHGNHDAPAPEMTLVQAGKLLLHQQILQILLAEAGVRAGTRPRYVHEMRVAIRRGRAALKLFSDTLDAEAIKPVEKGLKRLGRVLGEVRDLDVALSNLAVFRRSQPPALHPGIQTLRAELSRHRSHARHDLLALLDSKKHYKFITSALAFCTSPLVKKVEDVVAGPKKPGSKARLLKYRVLPIQVRHTLPSRILIAYEAVRAYETAFAAGRTPPLKTYHALRIQAKVLRYLLEFAHHLLGEEGHRLISRLRELQDDLGALNDAHVERERLHLWLHNSSSDPKLRQAIEARLLVIQNTLDRLCATTPAHLAALISISSRQMLATALAKL